MRNVIHPAHTFTQTTSVQVVIHRTDGEQASRRDIHTTLFILCWNGEYDPEHLTEGDHWRAVHEDGDHRIYARPCHEGTTHMESDAPDQVYFYAADRMIESVPARRGAVVIGYDEAATYHDFMTTLLLAGIEQG